MGDAPPTVWHFSCYGCGGGRRAQGVPNWSADKGCKSPYSLNDLRASLRNGWRQFFKHAGKIYLLVHGLPVSFQSTEHWAHVSVAR
jgi:hypothetical protein